VHPMDHQEVMRPLSLEHFLTLRQEGHGRL
jgi:hypothetical protein